MEVYLTIEQFAMYEGKSPNTIRKEMRSFDPGMVLPNAGRGKKGGSLISSHALSKSGRMMMLGDPTFSASPLPDSAPSCAGPASCPQRGLPSFWLPVRQAAERWGADISPKTLKRWCKEGKISKWRRQQGYEIHVSALPDESQIAWYLDQGLEIPDRLRKGVRPAQQTPSALDELPIAKRQKAIAWAETLRDFDRVLQETSWPQAKAAASFCATEEGLKPGTLLRKYRAWKKEGLLAIAPKAQSGRPKSDVDPQALAFLYEHYLRSSLPNKALSARATLAKAGRVGWQTPSEATLTRYLDDIPYDVKVKHQRGAKALAEALPSMLRDYEFPAMECWVSDHHQCNVAVLDGDRVVFPWLSAWMDMRSRKLMGWMVCLQPNSDTVAYTLHQGLVAFGGPTHVITDNGKDYKSRRFTGGNVVYKRFRPLNQEGVSLLQGVFTHLGITPHFTIPYNAKAKPIERFFRTYNEQFISQLPGYRGRNVTERPERLAEEIKRGALLKLDEFIKQNDRWIQEIYHQQEHRGRGMKGRTPNQVFEGERLTVAHIPKENLRLLLLRFADKRKYGKNGISVFGEQYRAADAQKHLELKDEWVWVRYDPKDLSTVCVSYLKDDTFAAELECKSRTGLWDQDGIEAHRKEQKAIKEAMQEFYSLQTQALEEKIAVNDRVGLSPTPPRKPDPKPAAPKTVRLVPKAEALPPEGGTTSGRPPEGGTTSKRPPEGGTTIGGGKVVEFRPGKHDSELRNGTNEEGNTTPVDEVQAMLQAAFASKRQRRQETQQEQGAIAKELSRKFGF